MLIMPSRSKKWIFENFRWKQRLLFKICFLEVSVCTHLHGKPAYWSER